MRSYGPRRGCRLSGRSLLCMNVDCNVSMLGCYQSQALAPRVRYLVYDGGLVTIVAVLEYGLSSILIDSAQKVNLLRFVNSE